MSTSDARHEYEITQLTSGLPNRHRKAMCDITSDNVLTIANYIQSMKMETNLSNHYKRDLILLLCTFSKYNYDKPYKDLKRGDILAFLNSFAKPEESDPLHKWIGTYNIYREHLQRFFKWLYHPNIEPSKRSKPSVVDNIQRLKRKEQSIYSPSDLWTTEEE
jgi:site-specific recombinase XerD